MPRIHNITDAAIIDMYVNNESLQQISKISELSDRAIRNIITKQTLLKEVLGNRESTM